MAVARVCRSIVVITAVGGAGHCAAAVDPWTLNLYIENDLFAETDQNYTSGVRASWVSPDVTDYLDDPALPGWVEQLNERLTFLDPRNSDLQRNVVLTLGQTIFTPQDRVRTTLDPDDRPYAAWLYAGVGYHSKTRDRLDSVELNIGMVGPAALGQEAQDFIHELRDFEKFEGWDNQLRNELGLQLVYEYKYREEMPRFLGLAQQDFIIHGGASLGNVASYLNVGAEYRIGWHLPQDFGTSALRPGGDNSAPGGGDPRRNGNWGLHLFVSVDGRWVWRDIFLDGNSFRDSHSVDKEPLVADLAVGASALVGRWKFSFAKVHRSREFRGQPHHHSYGSISLSYSF